MMNRTKAFRTLYDIDLRLKIMDEFDGWVQVLTITGFPVESLVEPKDAAELAKMAQF